MAEDGRLDDDGGHQVPGELVPGHLRESTGVLGQDLQQAVDHVLHGESLLPLQVQEPRPLFHPFGALRPAGTGDRNLEPSHICKLAIISQ